MVAKREAKEKVAEANKAIRALPTVAANRLVVAEVAAGRNRQIETAIDNVLLE